MAYDYIKKRSYCMHNVNVLQKQKINMKKTCALTAPDNLYFTDIFPAPKWKSITKYEPGLWIYRIIRLLCQHLFHRQDINFFSHSERHLTCDVDSGVKHHQLPMYWYDGSRMGTCNNITNNMIIAICTLMTTNNEGFLDNKILSWTIFLR